MEYGFCCVSISPVRSDKKDQSEIVTQLLFGEIVSILELDAPWAKVSSISDSYEGWIDHKHIKKLTQKEVRRWSEGLSFSKDRERLIQTPWGRQWICQGSFVPENEESFNIGADHFAWLEPTTQTFDSIWNCGESYLNTPYLWGGKSPFGIDCSGLTQAVYRFFDINLPRDASQQVLEGTEVEFGEQQSGDLAFFENSAGKIIHVGILDDQGHILHASGHVRKDLISREGIVHSETGELTHKLTTIKRW